MVTISEVAPGDGRLVTFLDDQHITQVARRGVLLDVRKQSALLASSDDETVGVLTYDIDGQDCEIVYMRASGQWGGVGTELVDRVAEIARRQGCSRLWLVTTNDNIDALRFYQRRGFRLATVRCGAAAEARRRQDPQLPEVGNYGIPVRDELEFERDLESAT
ncbi:GNAT family N-acetyltransferase [Skermania sp. ID1734]|uniref:GNAT family N-acetyltransferase n=1 Tax=Skermania sp. ID1734 TaxID=2597516 RepID=UPI00117EA474|nr:GNAT family N-acetyltransferase [Skermania sp. ID1734]TSD94242.1 GNAT family N-acetyltransferase [Skermania sp. ID1734]